MKPYQKEAKNAQALTRVQAWLKAANISAKPSSNPGCDLTVQGHDGAALEIKVGVSADDVRPAVNHLFLLAGDLTHRKQEIAIKAFHTITKATGHGTPLPINRGVAPAKKLHFDDNFELVVMRHKEFRKVPNPSSEELQLYKPVIAKAVARWMFINAKIAKRHGLEFEDIQTYAQIWTCNYLGLYKVANPQNNDNERKLYAHLCQRLHNFVEVLLKKERNTIPDLQTASTALLGKPHEPHSANTVRRVFQPDQGLSYMETKDQLETSHGTEVVEPFADMDAETEEVEQEISDTKRRKLAQTALKTEFGKLSHERLLFVLEEAMTNPHLCPDARTEARKQLRLHKAGCASCLKAQDEVASVERGSV